MKTKGPKLFTSMKGYTTKQLTKDIVAGILVAIIAFPLSVALAISSGMSPETGLYSAIIGGFFVSAFGGSKVNIGGVTAATVMTVFTIIEEFGLAGLAVASVIAGLILILLGILKAGVLLRYIPRTITLGFTAGIAEMLIQSHEDMISLIPAIPAKWNHGSFRGLCARGGYEVDAKWEQGDVKEFEIRAKFVGEVVVELPETQKNSTFIDQNGNTYTAVENKLTLNVDGKLHLAIK